MCGIQAGFDGKSLLPLNFRSLSGASPLPPHPPFPLFLRPTNNLHQGQSPCTRTLRAGAAPHPQEARPHSLHKALCNVFTGPCTLLLALPPIFPGSSVHTRQTSELVHYCAFLLFVPLVGISFPLGLATSPCVVRPTSACNSLCSPCPGSDYISPHV